MYIYAAGVPQLYLLSDASEYISLMFSPSLTGGRVVYWDHLH